MSETGNRKPAQVRRVLDYMQQHGSITQYEAMVDIGVMRLASRISELKRDGYQINKKMVAVKNRYGETCHVNQYSLRGGEIDGKA